MARTAKGLKIRDEGGDILDAQILDFVGSGVTASDFGDGIARASIPGGSGSTISIPTGTVNGVNTTFTASATPLYIVIDGVTYFENDGYIRVGLVITTVVPPTGFIYVFS